MCTYIYKHIHLCKNFHCLIYCILSYGEVIKYHKFISVVVIELSVRCLNTGPEDRLQWNHHLTIWSASLLIISEMTGVF